MGRPQWLGGATLVIAGAAFAFPLSSVGVVAAAPPLPPGLDASVFDTSAFPDVLLDLTPPRQYAAATITADMVELGGRPVASLSEVDPATVAVSLVIDDGPVVPAQTLQDAQGASVEFVRLSDEGTRIALSTPSGMQSALTSDRDANIARIAGIVAGAPDVVPLPELVLDAVTRLAAQPSTDRQLVIVQSTSIAADQTYEQIATIVNEAHITVHLVAAPGLDVGPIAALAEGSGGRVPTGAAMVGEMDEVTSAISDRYRVAATVDTPGPQELVLTIDGQRFPTTLDVQAPVVVPTTRGPTTTVPAAPATTPTTVPSAGAASPTTVAAPPVAATPTTVSPPREGFGRGVRLLVAVALAVLAIVAAWIVLRRRAAPATHPPTDQTARPTAGDGAPSPSASASTTAAAGSGQPDSTPASALVADVVSEPVSVVESDQVPEADPVPEAARVDAASEPAAVDAAPVSVAAVTAVTAVEKAAEAQAAERENEPVSTWAAPEPTPEQNLAPPWTPPPARLEPDPFAETEPTPEASASPFVDPGPEQTFAPPMTAPPAPLPAPVPDPIAAADTEPTPTPAPELAAPPVVDPEPDPVPEPVVVAEPVVPEPDPVLEPVVVAEPVVSVPDPVPEPVVVSVPDPAPEPVVVPVPELELEAVSEPPAPNAPLTVETPAASSWMVVMPPGHEAEADQGATEPVGSAEPVGGEVADVAGMPDAATAEAGAGSAADPPPRATSGRAARRQPRNGVAPRRARPVVDEPVAEPVELEPEPVTDPPDDEPRRTRTGRTIRRPEREATPARRALLRRQEAERRAAQTQAAGGVVAPRARRRAEPVDTVATDVDGWLTVGDLRMCPGTGEVWSGKEPISLSPAELAVLELLMRSGGHGVTSEAIIAAAELQQGTPEYDDPDLLVSAIRRKTKGRGRGAGGAVRKERVLLYYLGDDEGQDQG